MTKKTYSTEFKRAVATEAIKGKKSVSQIANDFGVHQTLVRNWKKSFSDMDSPKNEITELLKPNPRVLDGNALKNTISEAKQLVENIFTSETDEDLRSQLEKTYRYLLDAEELAEVTDLRSFKKAVSSSETNIEEHLKQEAQELGHKTSSEYLANLDQSITSFSDALINEYCFFNANYEFSEYSSEAMERSSLVTGLREAFNKAEEAISTKSILVGITPSSLVGTYLDPSDRFIGSKRLLNCEVTLEFDEEISLTKRQEQSIVRAVDIFLKSTDYLDFELLRLFGYEDELSFTVSTEVAK